MSSDDFNTVNESLKFAKFRDSVIKNSEHNTILYSGGSGVSAVRQVMAFLLWHSHSKRSASYMELWKHWSCEKMLSFGDCEMELAKCTTDSRWAAADAAYTCQPQKSIPFFLLRFFPGGAMTGNASRRPGLRIASPCHAAVGGRMPLLLGGTPFVTAELLSANHDTVTCMYACVSRISASITHSARVPSAASVVSLTWSSRFRSSRSDSVSEREQTQPFQALGNASLHSRPLQELTERSLSSEKSSPASPSTPFECAGRCAAAGSSMRAPPVWSRVLSTWSEGIDQTRFSSSHLLCACGETQDNVLQVTMPLNSIDQP